MKIFQPSTVNFFTMEYVLNLYYITFSLYLFFIQKINMK
jgi:hypothetical protein